MCVTRELPAFRLKVGDRVTEEAGLGHIANIFSLAAFPSTVVFWRVSNESLTRHRNPIFDEELGVSPGLLLAVDSLHCLYLGVMLALCRRLVWCFLLSGIFCRLGSIEEKVNVGCKVICSSLQVFYTRYDKANPTKPLTRIHNFSKKHVGNNEDRALKTKGAQTWVFLLWCQEVLKANPGLPDWANLSEATSSLVSLVELWRGAGKNLSEVEYRTSVDFWTVFLGVTNGWDDLKLPKRHLTTHLVVSSSFFGNPVRFANWQDESLNRVFRATCRLTSQKTFESSVMPRMWYLLRHSKGVKRKL